MLRKLNLKEVPNFSYVTVLLFVRSSIIFLAYIESILYDFEPFLYYFSIN
jgi:hypothetical protein